MSNLLAGVLGAPEPYFTHAIKDWEQRSGHPSHDVRLVTDIRQRRQAAARNLGLDNADTTARELYFALRHRALADSDSFLAKLDIKPSDTVEKMIEGAIKYIEALSYPSDLWLTKQASIKPILKQNPPKKLMKILGLRSIDSILKRANISEFLALAYGVENEMWVDKLHNSYKKLRPSDFQQIQSSIVVLTPSNREKIVRSSQKLPALVRPVIETGTVFICPPTQRFKGDALSLTLAILEALNELRAYSAYFRHISVRNDFGLCFSSALSHGLPTLSSVIGWRDLQEYLTRDKELFESIKLPHLQKEDLAAPSALEVLARAVPTFDFWRGLESVFHHDKEFVVSCHLTDVLSDAINDLDVEQGSLNNMQTRLWQELVSRYLAEKHLQAEILKDIV